MIVAIDGQVGAGKSTLARALGRQGRVEPEYPHQEQAQGKGHWAVQSTYLDHERARRERLDRRRHPGPAALLVLDRSILSQAAHVHALAVLGLADNRQRMASYLREYPELVIEPDVLVLLDPDQSIRTARLQAREGGDERVGTDAIFRQATYEQAFSTFVDAVIGEPETAPAHWKLSDVDLGSTSTVQRLRADIIRLARSRRPCTASHLASRLDESASLTEPHGATR